MKTYELTYIISSQITSEQASVLPKEIESFVVANEGVVLESKKTGAQTLSYPIKKQHSGFFVTLTFQMPENKINISSLPNGVYYIKVKNNLDTHIHKLVIQH